MEGSPHEYGFLAERPPEPDRGSVSSVVQGATGGVAGQGRRDSRLSLVRRNDDDPTTRLPPGFAEQGLRPPAAPWGASSCRRRPRHGRRGRRVGTVPGGEPGPVPAHPGRLHRQRLGCGRFGCVYESEAPWVVKLTRDESEGPVWSYMAELLADEDIGPLLPSYLRVHDVVRIRPDVIFNDESSPCSASCARPRRPVFDQVAGREPARQVRHLVRDRALATTLKILGITPAALKRLKMESPSCTSTCRRRSRSSRRACRSTSRSCTWPSQATRGYRKSADVYHRFRWQKKRLPLRQALSEEALADMLAACTLMQRFTCPRNSARR